MQRAFPNDEIFFTDKQLCRPWQCSQMKLWRLRKKGVLESIKIGGIGVNLTPAPATVCSRRETDEDYEGVITRSGTLRVRQMSSRPSVDRSEPQRRAVAQ